MIRQLKKTFTMKNRLAECLHRLASVENNPPTILLRLKHARSLAAHQRWLDRALLVYERAVLRPQHVVVARLQPQRHAVLHHAHVSQIFRVLYNKTRVIEYFVCGCLDLAAVVAQKASMPRLYGSYLSSQL